MPSSNASKANFEMMGLAQFLTLFALKRQTAGLSLWAARGQ
jgi:hypothetical protein